MNFVQADREEQLGAASSSSGSSYSYSYSVLGPPCSGYTDEEMYAGPGRWEQAIQNERPIMEQVTNTAPSVSPIRPTKGAIRIDATSRMSRTSTIRHN